MRTAHDMTEKVFAVHCYSPVFQQAVSHWLTATFGENNIIPHPVVKGVKHLASDDANVFKSCMLETISQSLQLFNLKRLRVVVIGEGECLGYGGSTIEEETQRKLIIKDLTKVRESISAEFGRAIHTSLIFAPISSKLGDHKYKFEWVE